MTAMTDRATALHNALNCYRGRPLSVSDDRAEEMRSLHERWLKFLEDRSPRSQIIVKLGGGYLPVPNPNYNEEELFASFSEQEGLPRELSLAQVKTESGPSLSECILTARRNLKHGAGSIFDWQPKKPLIDDVEFERANPDHPCRESVRFIRQRAADFFFYLALAAPQHVSDEILEELHAALFDRDAAVRLQIARCLGRLRHHKSLPTLRRLRESETEDQMVQEALDEAMVAIAERNHSIEASAEENT